MTKKPLRLEVVFLYSTLAMDEFTFKRMPPIWELILGCSAQIIAII